MVCKFYVYISDEPAEQNSQTNNRQKPLSAFESRPYSDSIRPLSCSSPMTHHTHNYSSRNDFTLADYVTPDRKKTRKTPRKSVSSITPTVNNSSNGSDSSPTNTPMNAPKTANRIKASAPTLTDMKPSRRITPTVVSDSSQWSNFKHQAVFEPESPRKTKVKPGSFTEERRKLREKKAQLMTPIEEPIVSSSFATPSKSLTRSGSNSQLMTEAVSPELNLVTRASEVKAAASMFAALIAGKLL